MNILDILKKIALMAAAKDVMHYLELAVQVSKAEGSTHLITGMQGKAQQLGLTCFLAIKGGGVLDLRQPLPTDFNPSQIYGCCVAHADVSLEEAKGDMPPCPDHVEPMVKVPPHEKAALAVVEDLLKKFPKN